VSRRSSLTIECKLPGAGAPRPGRCCTDWGGGALHDANARCSGCSTCVASSKTRSRPINMRLVAHVAEKRLFFFDRELLECRSRAEKAVKKLPQKYPKKIPLQLPYNSLPANLLASNWIRYAAIPHQHALGVATASFA